jgi:predicted nucleic-acid-binding protein
MRAVDTNVLVRLLTRDDATQTAAAEQFVEAGAWISHVVLTEAIRVLRSVFDRDASDIANAVELLLNHRHLSLQDADVVEAAVQQFRRRPALGFPDCLVLEIARKSGHLPLGTFDRAVGRIDGAELL